MKKLFCGLLIATPLAFLLPAIAHANGDASISSDSGRSIENGQNDTVKRDKSLSTDKSQGNKSTDSASREKSVEKSNSRSVSQKISKSVGSSKSYSVDVNINGLLLREFTARYEINGTGGGTAGKYFWVCKPLTRAIADYPILFDDAERLRVVGRNEAQQLENERAYQLRMRPVITFDHNNPFFSRYVQCRMTASYWVAVAGERAVVQKVHTEAEVSDRIKQVFAEMEADDSIFKTMRQRARDLWRQESCFKSLEFVSEYKSPEIQCGIFSFVGNTFTVENRETLSESSIDGHSYKIAVSTSAGDTVAEDDSLSSDDKVSSTKRNGDSTERFKESKKTASMNKSKNIEDSSGSKIDRSTRTSMQAGTKD